MPSSELVNTAVAPQPSFLTIPGWGLDRPSYERACRYLRLSPSPAIYDKLARYLLATAATQSPLQGFGRWLAELRPGSFALGFLDLWTRLLLPTHPWRFRFNALVALHECDPVGYREMMSGTRSRLGAWLSLARIGTVACINFVAGGAWLLAQACAYALFGGRQRREHAYFHGKTVLVTGAGRGLGLALSTRLLSTGANVLAVARASPGFDELRRQIEDAGLGQRFRTVIADVAVPGSLSEGLAHTGIDVSAIDVAIVNAGVKETSTLACLYDSLKRVFAVNVFGAMDTFATLLPGFQARGKGHLIVISSLGRWHGMPLTGTYNASKAALSVLAESLAVDLLRDRGRIAVTTIEPGLIRTGMIGHRGLQRLLSMDTECAARRILQCATRGNGTCRFSFLFALMTLAIALLPFRWRLRFLDKVGRKD